MKAQLPLNAKEIGLEWPIEEGGIGVTARTDTAGLPYIGLYPLSPNGFPAGFPTEFTRDRLMVGVVAGYDGENAIRVFIDVEMTTKGLNLRVVVPTPMMDRGYDRYLSTSWGTTPPRASYDYPANSNWFLLPSTQR